MITTYINDTSQTFNQLNLIMTQANYGHLIRLTHSTGASVLFTLLYIHTARSIYYGLTHIDTTSLYTTGVTLITLSMAIAFLGYVLVWGSMSYWGSTVITNLLTSIPNIQTIIQGAFVPDTPTLPRLATLHHTTPIATLTLLMSHMLILHLSSSSPP